MFGFLDLLVIFGVVAGPTKALAVFAAHAGKMTPAERRATAVKSVTVAASILFLFALLGEQIIAMFHVSIPALEIAGGLILLVFALGIVLGGAGHDHDEGGSSEIAIYPMAMPLIASPQAIVAIVVVLAQTQELAGRLTVLAALATMMVINLAIFLGFATLMRGPGGAKKSSGAGEVILRVVAILLAALAVQLMIMGFRELGVIPPAVAGH